MMDDQEKAGMHKKLEKSKKEVSGLRKDVEKLKNVAADSKVIEKKLNRVIVKKLLKLRGIMTPYIFLLQLDTFSTMLFS